MKEGVLQGCRTTVLAGAHITFHVAMPPSWSRKKRVQLNGQPHTQVPDIDNFLKAFMDALLVSDAAVWRVFVEKRWNEHGGIEVTPLCH